MLEGLEAVPPEPCKDDGAIRDVSGFFDKDHDFSIVLISKRKAEKRPPQVIDILATNEVGDSSNPPPQSEVPEVVPEKINDSPKP